MIRIVYVIIIVLVSYLTQGQNFLTSSINLTESGRNLVLDYSRIVNEKHEFGLGARLNINSITQPDDQSNFYYRRLFATEFYQYFGIHAFYHLYLIEKLHCFKPYFFYDLQLTKSTTRSSLFIPAAIDNNGNLLYINNVEYFGPFIWIDQNIGLGFKVNIYKSIYLLENFGLGFTWIIGEDERLPQKNKYFETEFGYLITIGASISL